MSDGCIHKLFLAALISINLAPGNAASSMNCTVADCEYCPDNPICQRCNINWTLTGDRSSCVRSCPDGFSERLDRMNDTETFSRRCVSQSNNDDSSNDVPGVYIGIVVGVSIIVIIILAIMTIYCFYALRKGRMHRTLEIDDENMNSGIVSHQNEAFLDSDGDGQMSENTEEEDDDYLALADGDDEKVQFLRKLARLRKQSAIFLRMLNDMRRRLKELPQEATAAKSYKNVMQDVTRLLYLLNKNPRNVQIPPDGMQLLNWSEEILKRYLQSQQQQRTTHARISTYEQQAETHF